MWQGNEHGEAFWRESDGIFARAAVAGALPLRLGPPITDRWQCLTCHAPRAATESHDYSRLRGRVTRIVNT